MTAAVPLEVGFPSVGDRFHFGNPAFVWEITGIESTGRYVLRLCVAPNGHRGYAYLTPAQLAAQMSPLVADGWLW